jgi:hypothetical protein
MTEMRFWLLQLRGWLEARLERGMRNFHRADYGGVTETWNVIQHEVANMIN